MRRAMQPSAGIPSGLAGAGNRDGAPSSHHANKWQRHLDGGGGGGAVEGGKSD
jgi:hypothetical protein